MSDPLAQRTVHFYDDELVAIQEPTGMIFVIFPRLCANLGLRRAAQVRRIQDHAILQEGLVTRMIQTAGGPQETQCLRLDLLPLWLSGLRVKRVREEMQPKIERYQREAAHVLWDAFKPQLLVPDPHAEPAQPVPTTNESLQELQRIAEMGRAIAQMAEQQMELQRQQQHHAERLNRAGQVVKEIQGDVMDVQVRLGVLEDRLHPAAYITEEQATQVSTTVKALAEVLTRKEGKNQYQSVFAELYRRFGVSSYKLIRQEQYEAVLVFLEDWRAAATDSPGA